MNMEKVLIERFENDPNAIGRVYAESGAWELIIDHEKVPHLYVETWIDSEEEDGEVIKGMFCVEDMMADDFTIRDIMRSQFGGTLTPAERDEAEAESLQKYLDRNKPPPGFPSDQDAKYPPLEMVRWNRATIRKVYQEEGLPATDDVDVMRVALAKLSKAAKPDDGILLIEDVGDNGTQWVLSFGGPNPTEDKCVRCANLDDATKLKKLIEQRQSRA